MNDCHIHKLTMPYPQMPACAWFKKEIMTHKHFTEIINQADSDDNNKTCTDSVGTG